MNSFEVAISGRMNHDAAEDVAWQLLNQGGFTNVIINFYTLFGCRGSVEVTK
jgi:hypothetical protein